MPPWLSGPRDAVPLSRLASGLPLSRGSARERGPGGEASPLFDMPGAWTPADDDRLLAYAQTHLPLGRIAVFLQRDLSDVAQRLGLLASQGRLPSRVAVLVPGLSHPAHPVSPCRFGGEG